MNLVNTRKMFIIEDEETVRTVLVTGWVLDEEDPRLSEFDFWLQKPMSVAKVKETVAQAIELHDARTGKRG